MLRDSDSTVASAETYSEETVTAPAPFVDQEGAKEFSTDLRNWRLGAENGRHMWEYVENAEDSGNNSQSMLEKYWVGLPFDMPKMPEPERPMQTLENGWEFMKKLQTDAGNWGCNCDGPLFVTSGMVFSMYILGFEMEHHIKQEMCRYLLNIVNEDGGWPTYLESDSTVFGTTVNYVMLRVLGVPADHPVCVKARTCLAGMGGTLGIQTWGKWWLCVLGLYEWDGIIPMPPEVLLVPRSIPINPAQWWMPIRNIYISMSYLYGHRYVMPENDLIRSLREELYDQSYSSINWLAQRSNISPTDMLKPRTFLQRSAVTALGVVESWKPSFMRKRALTEALFHIEAEVHNTGYLCLTPVSWASNMICLWHAHGTDSHWVQGMKDRFIDPMWMCREGLAASGTDGTAVWDTSLTIQAICGSGLPLKPDDIEVCKKAIRFLDVTQIRQHPLAKDHIYRHESRGGWPFSTRDQGYAVSDTTSEAVRAILHMQKLEAVPKMVSESRIKEAIDLLIGLESPGGGYAAYEQVRGPEFLELFNITDSYENCMIELRYPECTGSVIMAMTEFMEIYPNYRTEELNLCIERSVKWLLKAQFDFGGWIGSWGVCFSFASAFALQGLARAGRFEANCPAVRKACRFFLDVQNEDGGWGESLLSSKAKVYIQEPKGSQVTNTSYAVLGLIAAGCSDHAAIERGVAFIMKIQQATGDWLPGTLEGIYTPPCGYRYPMYKFHFTLKAIGAYVQRYGNNKLLDISRGSPVVEARLVGDKHDSMDFFDEKAALKLEIESQSSSSSEI